MAKRRHASNPAKVKADYASLAASGASAGAPPPPAARWDRLQCLLVPVLAIATMPLLSLSLAPHDQWYLAYACLVPWTMSLVLARRRWWGLTWGYLTGLLFFAVNVYWVWWVDVVGYLSMVAYLSLYWLAAAAAIRSLLVRKLPATLVLPLVWVALEYARAWVISGFPWFFLGHSQCQQPAVIQIADLTSDYGVSFFVAMVNGAIVDWLTSPILLRFNGKLRLGRRALASGAAVLVAAGAILGYGAWRLGQNTTAPGPIIALVQQAFPITLNGTQADSDTFFNDHALLTEQVVGWECDLVVWPETMLPRGMNAEFLQSQPEKMTADELHSLVLKFCGPSVLDGRFDDDQFRLYLQRVIHGVDSQGNTSKSPPLMVQARRLGELSRKLHCPILAGAPSLRRNPHPLEAQDAWVTRNSALWFDGDWKSGGEYNKVHLVPFGEYVPFRDSWPWLHKFLRSFVPPVMDQLDPGRRFNAFTLTPRRVGPATSGAPTTAQTPVPQKDLQRSFRIATPICYEGTFARVCRAMVYKDGRKSVDILANLSNDGWFVHDSHGSTEQSQHLSQYVFRAIENRLPVVRAVNTGISASIDSNGRIVAQVEQYGQPVMAAGSLLLDGRLRNGVQYQLGHGPRVLVDSRVSGYSLVGDLFARIVCLAAAGLLGWSLWKSRVVRKGNSNERA